MTPKPLSKERSAEIINALAFFRHHNADGEDALVGEVEDLLAAEQYWREAVKNADHFDSDYHGCNFGGECSEWNSKNLADHDPDCPWKLAQD